MLAEGSDCVHVDHFLQVVVVPNGDLLDLMGGTETVEEVDEGDTALDGGQVGNGAQVHDLLGVGLAEHGKTGLTAGVHVGVIAEDVQCVAGNGTGGDVEHAGQQLTRDLVHVGDHEQQALGRGVGGGQRAGSQRAVNGTGGTGLRLHLDDLDTVAEDVLPALSRPLVNIVGHGAGRSDGVDARHFREGVADVRGSGVAVHRLEFSLQGNYLLIKGTRVPYFDKHNITEKERFVNGKSGKKIKLCEKEPIKRKALG